MKTQSSFAHRPLGLILLESGLVDDAQLQAALRYKDEHGIKLGQALITLQMVDEAALSRALRNQGRLPCIHLTPGLVEHEVAQELGEETSRGHVAIALHRIAGVTSVAMSDPGDVYAVDAIALRLGTPVHPIYAEGERIAACIEGVFGAPERPARPAGREPHAAQEPSRDADRDLESLLLALVAEARERGQRRIGLARSGRQVVVRGAASGGSAHRVDLPEPVGPDLLAFLASLVPAPSAEGITRVELALGAGPEAERLEAWCLDGPAGTDWQLFLEPRPTQDGLTAGPRSRVEDWLATSGVVLWSQPAGDGDSGLLHLAERWTREGHDVAFVGRGPRSHEAGLTHLVPEPLEGAERYVNALAHLRPDRIVIDVAGVPLGAEHLSALVRAGARVVLRVGAERAREAWREFHGTGAHAAAVHVHGVVGRRRLPLLCRSCRRPLEPAEPGFTAGGCGACRHTGIGGEHHVLELFVPPGPGEDEGRYAWRFERALDDLLEQGEISRAAALELADPEDDR